MATFEIGETVQYCLPDREGKYHWFKGTIHGVRKYDESETTEATESYLIDTGRDERIDEFSTNPRMDEVAKRADAIVEDPKNPITDFGEAVAEAEQHDDLPEDEVVTETVRQPEQIELSAEHIRHPEVDRTVTVSPDDAVAPGRIKP